MNRKLKQMLTVLLSVCVLLSFSSVSAFAGNGGSPSNVEKFNDVKAKAIEALEAIDLSGFVGEELTKVKAAIDGAKAAIQKAKDEDAINKAVQEAQDVIAKVIEDKNALVKALGDAKAILDEVNKINTSLLSPENKVAVETAVSNMISLVNDANATAGQVKEAKQTLTAAVDKANQEQKALNKKISTVKNAKVSRLKVKAGKKKLTVTWKKNTKFAGYQISYKKAGSKSKIAKVNKAKTTKRVIKNLTSGKTYTVKMRGYKKINGKMYYGKWTKAKTARVQ